MWTCSFNISIIMYHHLLYLLLLLSIFFIAVSAQSNDSTYPTCPSSMCDGFNISYPFWRIDKEPNSHFCGYKGFGINCSTIGGGPGVPMFNLSGNYYNVQNIGYHYPYRTIRLSAPVDQRPNDCPRVRDNITLGTLPLVPMMSTVNISFHFNCTGFPSFATELRCLGFNERKSCVHVMNETTEATDWDQYSCSEEVITTVFKDRTSSLPDLTLPDLTRGLIGDLLRGGFELEWGTMDDDDCDKCEQSDGRCGQHDTRGFICFCSDGTITRNDCKGSNTKIWLKLVIGFTSAGLAIFVMFVAFYIWRRRNMKRRYYGSSYRSRNISSYASSMTDPEKNGTYHGVQVFKYRELEKATSHFDSRNELGDGGFGTVYQGKLKDGRVVAVKRLYENNYRRVEQFMNEVQILARLRHRNLVSLYGCTTHHSRELLLVYEYISNGTVADHLHGEKSSPGSLKWPTRMNIAIETASALVYLHASDIVHRDVKTNNILLDDSFTVKVADFGLSRLFPNNVTHVSTAPQGTPGYVDPEYHECYQLTSKSDVYSLGVVLVELISSMTAVDITRHRHEINLSTMAMNKIQNDAIHELVDPHLGYETDYEVRKMINGVAELAFQCLQNDRDDRPSMDEVLECLVRIQNGNGSKNKQDVLDGACDDAALLDHSQNMSPDSVAVAWSTSTISTSSG